MEDAPMSSKNPKSDCPENWIRLPKHKMATIRVQCKRSSRSSWTKSVRSSFRRTIMGKANSRKFYSNTVGKRFQTGNVYSLTVKTTPHKTVFAVWNYTRNSRTGQKLNKLVQRQVELTTRSTEWKSQQCVKWPETLGESVSVVDANAWAIMHWRSFVFVVSLSSLLSVSVIVLWLSSSLDAHTHCPAQAGSSLSLRSPQSHPCM